APVAVAARAGSGAGPRQLPGPFDRQHALHTELLEAQIVDLARVVEPVKIDVDERDPAAAVLLHQRERRAAHLFGRDAEALGQSAHERGLPCTEIADEQHDGAWLEALTQAGADVARFRF